MTTTTSVDVIVTGGVDTHQDLHVAAALDQLGRVLGTESFPTTVVGYRQLPAWLRRHGQLDKVGVECLSTTTSAATPLLGATRGSRRYPCGTAGTERNYGHSPLTDQGVNAVSSSYDGRMPRACMTRTSSSAGRARTGL